MQGNAVRTLVGNVTVDSGTHFADFFLTMALEDFGFVLVEPGEF